jgi:site-specific DNA-cytosine methylase
MLESGLERAIGKFTVAAYVEIEAFCVFNLVAQMEQGLVVPAPIWTDAKTFPSPGFHRKVHGIIGGYPCQPFSKAGETKGTDDVRHLWPYLRAHIIAIRPVWCWFENVDNHLDVGFDTVYAELSDLGYKVEAGIYSAAEIGATHDRKRLFILAVDNTYCQRQRPKSSGLPALRQRPLYYSPVGKYLHGQIERSGNVLQWPAAPGEPAHLWEALRTVKPGLGVTINGYNFREDLLRMLGNGVVEHTAEIAMRDLLRKHGLNHLIN